MSKITIELEIDCPACIPERIVDFVLCMKGLAERMPDFTSGKFHVPCICGHPQCPRPQGTTVEFKKEKANPQRN